LSRPRGAAKRQSRSARRHVMNATAIVMILIFLAAMGILNRYEFGRFD
jgi:hypothetical protein